MSSSSCVHLDNSPSWGFQLVLYMWKLLTAALKTRFLFNISFNFSLRYYEIFIPVLALSLNFKENEADTSGTIRMLTNRMNQ